MFGLYTVVINIPSKIDPLETPEIAELDIVGGMPAASFKEWRDDPHSSGSAADTSHGRSYVFSSGDDEPVRETMAFERSAFGAANRYEGNASRRFKKRSGEKENSIDFVSFLWGIALLASLIVGVAYLFIE